MFAAREKNNIYLMDAEQKVFTFHASRLKPILDQEGTFPGSEIVQLGKCLVLTTLLSPSTHSLRSPSQRYPYILSAPKFVHKPCFTMPCSSFLYKLKPSGTSFRWLCSTEFEFYFTNIPDFSRESSPLLELSVFPHWALDTAENHEDRDSLG